MAAVAVHICPLCSARQRTLLHEVPEANGHVDGTFSLFRCAGCELVYVSPRPDEETLLQLYDEKFYCTPSLRASPLTARVREFFHSQRQKRVERHVTPGTLLDVGCGDGAFVRHMDEHGWQASGFDISPVATRIARQENGAARIHLGRIEELYLPDEHFDCVTVWHVLEHVPEPLPFLRRCARLLRAGGVLVVAVPNIASLQARFLATHWWGLDVPRHLLHFTPQVLARALEHVSVRIEETNHFSLQYGPYAILHSVLDRVVTRRHFLSDFVKRTLPDAMPGAERWYNLAAAAILTPLLTPLCLADALLAPAFARGGFIEVYARKP